MSDYWADINAAQLSRGGLFHNAATFEGNRIIKVLMKKGASYNVQDDGRNTPSKEGLRHGICDGYGSRIPSSSYRSFY